MDVADPSDAGVAVVIGAVAAGVSVSDVVGIGTDIGEVVIVISIETVVVAIMEVEVKVSTAGDASIVVNNELMAMNVLPTVEVVAGMKVDGVVGVVIDCMLEVDDVRENPSPRERASVAVTPAEIGSIEFKFAVTISPALTPAATGGSIDAETAVVSRTVPLSASLTVI